MTSVPRCANDIDVGSLKLNVTKSVMDRGVIEPDVLYSDNFSCHSTNIEQWEQFRDTPTTEVHENKPIHLPIEMFCFGEIIDIWDKYDYIWLDKEKLRFCNMNIQCLMIILGLIQKLE